MSLPIFFITNDPWKGVGFGENYNGYHVISVDDSPYVDYLKERQIGTLSLNRELKAENSIFRSTRLLLSHQLVQDYLLRNSVDSLGVVFFKPQFDVVTFLQNSVVGKSRRVISLNADIKVAKRLENKLEFFDICKNNGIPTAPSLIMELRNIDYHKIKQEFGGDFVIQFGVGWFGNRTFFIQSDEDVNTLKRDYKNTKVKVSKFIDGIVLTNNVVIGEQLTYQSAPFLQLTDSTGELARFKGSTVGNAWIPSGSMPISQENIWYDIEELTIRLGSIARENGYRGFCGFDFLVSYDGMVYVQEMNARFTASAPFSAQLEKQQLGANLLDKHYESFGVEFNSSGISDLRIQLKGSRVVVRNTNSNPLTVGKSTINGVYYVKQKEVSYLEENFNLLAIQEDQCIVSAVPRGRVVNPDQELLHIQSINDDYETLKNTAKRFKKEIFDKPDSIEL